MTSSDKMNAPNEYHLHICYQFHGSYFKKTFNKMYRCKWMAIKGCMSEDNQIPSSSTSGTTEIVETTGRRDELIEFVSPVPISYNYDDDVTVRFELFCAEKSMSKSFSLDSRRNSDTVVRFRNSNEALLWSPVDCLECDLNAVVHRGRLSEEEDGRIREGSCGRFTVISERAPIDRVCAEKQIRMEVSISQLEKRGKMKHTDLETYLAIHRKSLLKDDYVIVYRSPKTMEITSTSLHKFPEIIISREKLLGGFEDRVIYFTLRNAANGDVIGEADVSYSHLVADGKTNLKLRSRDINGNTLFGVSKRSLHPVGVLHVNSYVDNSAMNCSSRGSSASSQSCTEDRCRHSVKNSDDDELSCCQHSGNIMMADGRTQAYLISLLAPTVEVRLRQPLIRSSEPLTDNNFYKCASKNS